LAVALREVELLRRLIRLSEQYAQRSKRSDSVGGEGPPRRTAGGDAPADLLV
jgi:hypothetical protein